MIAFIIMLVRLILLLLFFLPLHSQDFLNKSTEVGKTFSIAIYSEIENEKFEIGDITPPIISNILSERDSDKHVFKFLCLSPGQTKLAIKKIYFNYIIDDYLIYQITVKSNQPQKVKSLKPQIKTKKNNQNSLEKSRHQLIDELYDADLFSQALKEIEKFKQQFPQSSYLFPITIIHAGILEKQKKSEVAFTVIDTFLKEKKDLSANKKAELYQISSKLKGEMDQNGEAITLLLKAKSLPNLSVTNIEKLHYNLGNYYLKEKKYVQAFSYYEKIYFNHTYKKKKYKMDDLYEHTLIKMAEILEISPEIRDIARAYSIYNEFIFTYPKSPFLQKVQKKKKYLKQNFIEPR